MLCVEMFQILFELVLIFVVCDNHVFCLNCCDKKETNTRLGTLIL